MPYTPVPVGPESGPEPPFPYRMEGKVISGYGRGSKELGIPTANLPVDHSATPWIQNVPSGVYFGYAALDRHPHPFPMVMSIGYNPFYKNSVRSAEVHLLHAFEDDFYGAHMRLLILGFIREERDYPSVKDLVEDINSDCESARISLARPGWSLQSVNAAWGEKRE